MTSIGVVSTVFVLLLAFLANPFGWWMPTELEYATVAALAIVAALFVGLMVGEKVRDEREVELRARAARIGYLAGVLGLTFALAVPVLMGKHPDVWIIGVLGVMVLARLIARKSSE